MSRVIVVAGPSGSGKSRLARRLGLPVLNLDDFYRDGSDSALPRVVLGHESVVDWDDPASWLREEAVAALDEAYRRLRALVRSAARDAS